MAGRADTNALASVDLVLDFTEMPFLLLPVQLSPVASLSSGIPTPLYMAPGSSPKEN